MRRDHRRSVVVSGFAHIRTYLDFHKPKKICSVLNNIGPTNRYRTLQTHCSISPARRPFSPDRDEIHSLVPFVHHEVLDVSLGLFIPEA
jgi:hypothetical protein